MEKQKKWKIGRMEWWKASRTHYYSNPPIFQSSILYYLFIFLILNSQFSPSFGQATLVPLWNKSFGGSGDDELFSFPETRDKGYILGGTSYSDISGDKTQSQQGGGDYWIVKTDSLGVKQWDKRFGGTDNDYLFSVQQTSDGGYILGGASVSDAGGDRTEPSRGNFDYWIVKTDPMGNKQWDRRFGGTDDDWLFAVQQTADGGYILGGSSLSGIGGDKTQASRSGWDYWIVKTDALGNKQWDRRFGGSGDDFFYSLQQTTDGGYILGGTSYSGNDGDKSQAGRGLDDFWVIKITSTGTRQWDKRFGGFASDDLYTLKQTFDGGYVAAGISNSDSSFDKTESSRGYSDFWIVKMDATGAEQWNKDFGGADYEDDFGSIVQTADSGYLLAGTSYSGFGGDKSQGNLGSEQTWIVKTTASGNRQWDKTLFTGGHDEAGFAYQTEDGCYVAANFTDGSSSGINTYKTESSRGGYDYWLFKFCIDTTLSVPVSNFFSSDSDFCETAAVGKCISFFDISSGNPTSWKWFFAGASPDTSIEPNPANICYGQPGTYPVTLIVANAAGKDSLTVLSSIIVKPVPPDPVVTSGIDTLRCSLSTSGGLTYQWYINGNLIAGATEQWYIPTQPGNYSVYVSESDGCGKLSQSVDYKQKLGIYPSPAHDWLAIRGLDRGAENTLQIYNSLGQLLNSFSIGKDQNAVVNLAQFAAGVYYIKINSSGSKENSSFVAKFVKE